MCVEAMRKWGIPKAIAWPKSTGGKARRSPAFDVSAVLAHHVTSAGAQTPDAVGYVLDLDGIVVYHTGDSLYHPDMRAVKDRGVRQ